MTQFIRTIFYAVCFATATLAWSQSVHWEPPAGTLAFNQTSELQLVFDNCEPKEDPAIPAIPGLQMKSVGQASNMSIVNGRVSQTVAVTFHVRASQRGSVSIPSFAVTTNKGRIQVPAATYDVGDATVGQGNVSLDAVANSRVDVPSQVWAGEVFRVEYALTIGRRYFHSLGSNQPEWNPAPLAIEEWSKPDLVESITAGEPRVNISYRTRAYIKQPGEVTLNPASQLVNLNTGTPSFGFFARPNLEQYTITSTRSNITVKELPAGKPAGFNGAVGQFKLESKIVPAASTVGEPITWTLTLTGTGNWPDLAGLPGRDVSRDFRVVQPQARRTMKEGALFEGTLSEDVVLIPTQPGNYTLGPITWAYFDPSKGQYQTISTEKVSIVVSAPSSSTGAPSVAPAPVNSSTPAGPSQPSPSAKPVTPPAAPQAIPRDPLEGSEVVMTPWNSRVFAIALLVPVPVLLVLWVALALRRARATDPFRPQREAQARLRNTISALRQTSDRTQVQSLLQAWQRDTAILWQLTAVVPAVHHFRSLATEGSSEANAVWANLWKEAESALYRSDGTLPADWTTRADSAIKEKKVPGFSAVQLFRGRNLLPFAAAVLFAFFALPHVHADETKSAYDRGDFSTAETSWRKTIAEKKTDWIARHNLALSLAQQNRWGEASAYAISAFIQHPRDQSVQWHLRLAGDRAGFVPGSIGGFLNPTPLHSLARFFSPAEWQRILVGSVGLAVLGLATFLFQAYGVVGRWSTSLALILISGAVIGGIIGSVSLGLYQETKDVRSAVIWKPSVLRSIPTEADTTQKTSPLAAGTIAIIEKSYLGWFRLAFANGQTGWVRQDDLVKLWQ